MGLTTTVGVTLDGDEIVIASLSFVGGAVDCCCRRRLEKVGVSLFVLE
jgi:hypothetical protein